jgi:hypothetical protein
MKLYKKFAAAIFAFMFAFSFFLAPASTVNAYSVGIGTLNVYSTYAYAATSQPGSFVDVGLMIIFRNHPNDQNYYDRGDIKWSDNGFVDVTVSLPYYNLVITYAISHHGNGNGTMAISWDPLNGYTPLLY